jgi:thymidylate synthase
MASFRAQYSSLLADLLDSTDVETNRRTGVAVRVLDPCSIAVDLSAGLLPVCGIRRTYPKTAAAEVAWFLLAKQDVSFIRKYAPIWDKFVEDDGQTVAGAYGHRWRKHFGRDQIGDAIETLIDDPTNRRVFISAWDPAADGLGRPSKNVPCPVGFTLSITGKRLNSTLLIRSSDVFVGLPYDVMGHALLLKAIQTSINNRALCRDRIQLGTMQVSLAHPHLYEVHTAMAEKALSSEPCDATIDMPEWGVRRIGTLPDEYVALVAGLDKELTARPEYSCRPEIVL